MLSFGSQESELQVLRFYEAPGRLYVKIGRTQVSELCESRFGASDFEGSPNTPGRLGGGDLGKSMLVFRVLELRAAIEGSSSTPGRLG